MLTQINLGGIAVDVVLKDIKNVHLSVYPPTGAVRISAPLRMSLDTIRVFAISKIGWIKQQQTKLHLQQREPPREYLDRESHYVWGKRYLLKLVNNQAAPAVQLKHNWMYLRARPAEPHQNKQAILEAWYREQIKITAPPLVARWEKILGVKLQRFFVRRMKTKWGSCTPSTRSIRLNTDLAKKPRECLEYVIVHEMAHLLEPTHNARFVAIMDRAMPQWRQHRQQLNQLPIRHENWTY